MPVPKPNLGDGTWERSEPGGLTSFGRDVICSMGELGLVLAVAHMPPKTFSDDMDATRPPTGLEDVGCVPRLTRALIDAGFTEDELVNRLTFSSSPTRPCRVPPRGPGGPG